MADICKTSSATNESYKVDSVVLHILIQQDNCVCQKQPVSLVLGMSGDSSALDGGECGFAVDINHIPTGNAITPTECSSNVGYSTKQVLLKRILEFKTRIINGTYTSGYCNGYIKVM